MPGRPNPAPGNTPAPEAGPPTPPAAGTGPAGLTSPGPACPYPAPGNTPAPEAGPPTPPAAAGGPAGFTSPGPAWPKPAPGITPAPEAGPPTPPRTARTWACTPLASRQATATARTRAGETQPGEDRHMAIIGSSFHRGRDRGASADVYREPSLHPCEDGNGRLARAITDRLLAQDCRAQSQQLPSSRALASGSCCCSLSHSLITCSRNGRLAFNMG